MPRKAKKAGSYDVAGDYSIGGNYDVGGDYPIAGDYHIGGDVPEYTDYELATGGNIFDDIWGGVKSAANFVVDDVVPIATKVAPLAMSMMGAGNIDATDLHILGRLDRIEHALKLPHYDERHHADFVKRVRSQAAGRHTQRRRGGEVQILGTTASSRPPVQRLMVANQIV